MGSCKVKTCDFSAVPTNGAVGDCTKTVGGLTAASCTPTCKTGYTVSGTRACGANGVTPTAGTTGNNFACNANACTAASINAAVSTSTTASIAFTGTPKPAGTIGAYTGTLASGGSGVLTCKTGYTATKALGCAAGVVTAGECKLKTCDFSAVPAASCTPTCKTGYTVSGTRACGANGVTPTAGTTGNNFACTANACSAASINAAVSTSTTASIAFTGTPKPAGAIGAYTGTLASGGSGVLTCKPGYTASKTLGCTAAAVTAGKCEADCATALVKPPSMTFTGTPTCTAGNKLKGGTTCTWGTPSAGNTCTTAKCKDGTLTQSTCAKTTCDCGTAPANGAVGTCTKTQAQSTTCQKTCNSGYEANVNTKCTCDGTGVKTLDTFSCKAKTADTCTITQTYGTKGGCNGVGSTTPSGTTCTTACNAGYMTQTLKTTCTNGVATCNCHSSCAPGSCYTSSASDCTSCKSDDYTLTANKDSRT